MSRSAPGAPAPPSLGWDLTLEVLCHLCPARIQLLGPHVALAQPGSDSGGLSCVPNPVYWATTFVVPHRSLGHPASQMTWHQNLDLACRAVVEHPCFRGRAFEQDTSRVICPMLYHPLRLLSRGARGEILTCLITINGSIIHEDLATWGLGHCGASLDLPSPPLPPGVWRICSA